MITSSNPFFPVFRDFMCQVAAHEPIYDLGTSARFVKEMAYVKDVFEGKDYKAGGFEPDFGLPDPCDFHCDVQALTEIERDSVGSIISLEVLEHVQDPRKTVEEAYRVLKPGGICLLTTPFMTSYHGKTAFSADGSITIQNSHTTYADYWRFTHEGLYFLFRQAGFSSIRILPVNGPLSARFDLLKLGPTLLKIPRFAKWLYRVEEPRLGKLTTRHLVFAIK